MVQIVNAPSNSITLTECRFEHIRPSLVLSAHRSPRFFSLAFMKIAVGSGWMVRGMKMVLGARPAA
jgi:hypothetical protein